MVDDNTTDQDNDQDKGSMHPFDDGSDPSVKDTDDGGALISLDDETEVDDHLEFYANLAETLSDGELTTLSADLLESIQRDKEARKKRDDQYEEGIKRTGLGDEAPGGADFEGASKVVHPMLTEICVDFAARAIKELFPRSGPVKDYIPGDVTQKKLEKARRKSKYMNWQLTEQMKEFRAELEQLLTQVPLGGAQYLKIFYDHRLKRPHSMFVPIDDVYLPYAATSFEGAERKTHVQYLTELEYGRKVRNGEYRDVDFTIGEAPELTGPAKANDAIEGKEQSAYNEDGLRTVFEIYCYAEIDEEDNPLPYIVTIDKHSRKVLAIYRNWDAEDEKCEELAHIVDFPFVPWRGAYPIGIPHMVGGLSAAMTGSLRALLDSAHINNTATLAKLKGGSKGGQSLQIEPTQIVEIEGSINVDDIRKTMMPIPFNPPSPVLFQLLGFLVDAGKGVVQTTFENISDQNPNMPVGTTLALIEQGMTVFSAIHARLHDSMARVLKILHRINKMYLEETDVLDDTGELMVKRHDFEGPLDVVPVSDPNIFSETQRFAQIQVIADRAKQMPQLYDLRKVEELILERIKIPNAKELLLPKPEAHPMNAVNENMAATLGRPIIAFPNQDHLAHLKVHIDYLMSPVLGQNPLMQRTFLPAIITHMRDHITMFYVATVVEVASQAAGQDITKLMDPKDEDINKTLDQVLAAASPHVMQEVNQQIMQAMPVIQQAMQAMQGMMPPQSDPMQAQMMAAQAAQQDVQRKAQADQMKAQNDAQQLQIQQAKLQQDSQKQQNDMEAKIKQAQADMQMELIKHMLADEAIDKKSQTDLERAQMEIDSREKINMEDNETAMRISAANIMEGHMSRLRDGRGINPAPLGSDANPSGD